MKRWKKVTIWVASILIVLVAGGLFAANYAVDKVLDSMVGMSVDDLLEDEDIAVEGEELDIEVSPTPDAVTPDESADQETGMASTNQLEGTSQQGSSNASGQDSNAAPNNEGSSEKPTASEKPATTTKPESGKSDSGYTVEISTDKAKEVEENITVAEKAKVVTTLMSSLSASEIATLQKLASGGLSQEEKKEARDLMLEKLSEDQYNELIAIAAKHGLSQGKSYSEVKEE